MRRNIFFIGSALHMRTGSSFLRSRQLRDIARTCRDFADVQIEVSSDTRQTDSILIFNKNALESIGQDDIDSVKGRRNYIVADPLDCLLDERLLSNFDCVIAASIVQFAHYTAHLPIRVAYVGHHVDTRLPPVRPRRDRFLMGYFGLLKNTRYIDDLKDHVAFSSIDTKNAYDTAWMSALEGYNAHYAIRSAGPATGFKPFTKGFIAAHCASPILIAEDDREARHFLPAAYPYFTATDSPRGVITTIERMADDFGSRDWTFALSVMNHVKDACSTPLIARQLFEALCAAL